MTPKADHLITERVAREREWAYEAWLARLSFTQIRQLANRPESDGGLGYDLSPEALKGLVRKAREDRGDLTMSREERIERQAAEVDARGRAAREDYDAARRELRKPKPKRKDFVEDADYLAAVGVWSKTVEANARLVDSADRRLESVHAREAKLFGLDAPVAATLEVTTRDAVTDELNEMLARASVKRHEVDS